MVAATMTEGSQGARFCDGFKPFHAEEIAAAKELAAAAVLIYGRVPLQRLLRKDAGKAFKRLRYGRRLMPPIGDDSEHWVCLMIDQAPFFGNKADAGHMMYPGRRGWTSFAKQVGDRTNLPRWADGFTATAEVLDDLGYAIAESIAAMLAFEIGSDDEVMWWRRRRR